MFLENGNTFLVNGNMFLIKGKLFLVNGKCFINISHISCGFLKYAYVFLKQLQLEITYQMLKHITITLK